jgi:hypothetical protein
LRFFSSSTRKDYTFYGIYDVIVFLYHDTYLLLLKILRPNSGPLRRLRPSRTKEFDLPGSCLFLKCITVKFLELDYLKGKVSKLCWSEMQETGSYSRLFFGVMGQIDSYVCLPTCLVATNDVNLTFEVG